MLFRSSLSAPAPGNEPPEQLPSSEDEVDHFLIANISNSPVDFNLMATEQLKDFEVQQMLSLKSLKIRKTKIGNTHLFCDFSTGNLRPLVPCSQKQAIFKKRFIALLIQESAQPKD